jgi:hypothetical protein
MASELPDELFECFWVVYSDFHEFTGRFFSYNEACETAEKLAARHPDDACFVMESRCMVRAKITTTRRYAVSRDLGERQNEPT